MYTNTITNKEIEIYKKYTIKYEYDPVWDLQSLYAPLLDIPGYAPYYCVTGARLTFADCPTNKNYVKVLCNSNLLGIIPIKVFQDYSSKNFIKWEAYYWAIKGRRYVWFHLK